MSIVKIKPIDKLKWHKHTGSNSFKRPEGLRAFVDSTSRKYVTGLNYVDKSFSIPGEGNKKFTEAEYYEKLTGLDLSNSFTGEPHPTWDSRKGLIMMEDNVMFFDTSIPLQYVQLKVLKASKLVANSENEYEEGLFPEAMFVLIDDEEQADETAKKIELETEALLQSRELTEERKKQIILVLAGKDVKSKSTNFVNVELNKQIKKNPKEFLDFIAHDPQYIATKALVLECISLSILMQEGMKVKYADITLGIDVETTVEYLLNDENQELLLRLKSQIAN